MPSASGHQVQVQGSGAHEWKSRLRLALPSLFVSFILLLVVYALLRTQLGSDVTALAIGGAFPAAWTAGRLLWRRRLDPLGLLAVLGFSIELCISVLTGGNSFVLKLQEAPLTGACGLALLASVAIRRPLFPVVLRLLGLEGAASRLQSSTSTLGLGAILCIDAIVRVILAAMLPTSTFLATSREVNWAIIGLGILVLTYVRRAGARAR